MKRLYWIALSLAAASCATRPLQEPASQAGVQQPPAVATMDLPTGLYQFRGNNTHTFYGTGPLPEREPKILWRFRTGVTVQGKDKREWQGLGWTGQPAIAQEDGRWIVYAASLDGHVYKLDFQTGQLLLKSERNFNIMKSSPTLTEQYVLIGSWDNAMHILDRQTLRRVHYEEAVYTPSASYDFDGSAAVENGFAYFAGEDGYVRKISLQPPFERIWLFPQTAPKTSFLYKDVKPYVGIESSVALHGDTVVVGSGRGHVYFLNKNTGTLLADFESGDDTDSSPLIDPSTGEVYIGKSRDFTSQPGGLYKLGLDGKQHWFFPVGATGIYSSAAFYRGTVLVTADDGYLYAIHKHNGTEAWKAPMPANSWSSPVVIGDRVLTADYAGALALFDAASGKRLWQKRLPTYIVSTPAVWEGVIVVGCRDGYIYALKESD
jgi:outer membrane protein assembly factor BamB